MIPGDKDDIFHALDTIAEIFSDPETSIYVFEHPFAEITASHGVVTFC
jgi:hypothetical protein